jgi:hypothetical protein
MLKLVQIERLRYSVYSHNICGIKQIKKLDNKNDPNK